MTSGIGMSGCHGRLRPLRAWARRRSSPRHRRRRLHRVPRRRRACSTPASDVRIVDCAASRRPRRPARRTSIRGAELARGRPARPGASRRARSTASSAVCHQASMVGLGVDLADIADYVGHNDLGDRRPAAGAAAARFDGRLVLASSMVVYGEGRYRCRRARARARRRRARPPTSTPGASSRAARRAAGRSSREPVPEDAPAGPAQRLRRDQAPPGAPVRGLRARDGRRAVTALRYHNVYGPRMPRDTPYAGVASIFRSRAGSAASRRGCSRTAPSGATSCTSATWPAPTSCALDADAPSTGRLQRRLAARRAASARWPARCGRPPAPTPRSSRGSPARGARGDVRHVFASVDRIRAELGYTPQECFADGMREFATAELRAPAAAESSARGFDRRGDGDD